VAWFSRKLDIPESRFFGVITFYPKFRTRPVGKNTVTVCCGAACHIKGADKLLDSAREALGLSGDEDTAKDLTFTLQKATCIGACNIAPVVLLNKQVHGGMDPVKVTKLIKGYEREEFLGYL
jgi:NADH:ubiquinone oxidoreductase subunit E